VQVEDQASRAIYVRLRHRARVLRGLGVGFVVLIALALLFGTIPYFLAGDMAASESRTAREMRRFDAEQHAKDVELRDRVAGETARAPYAESPDPTAVMTGGAGTPPAQAHAPSSAAPTLGVGQIPELTIGDEAFSAAVIRITNVVLLIALVYLLGGLYRYTMRLASYYDEKADALRLLEAGDRQLEARLAQITVPGMAWTGTPVRRRARV
jgi:hypothetical protein